MVLLASSHSVITPSFSVLFFLFSGCERTKGKNERKTNKAPAFGRVVGVFDDEDEGVEDGSDEQHDENKEVDTSEERIRVLGGQIVKDREDAVSIQQRKQCDTCPVKSGELDQQDQSISYWGFLG